MHRRKFLTILGAAAFGGAPAASAQTPSRVYRLGTMSPGAAGPRRQPEREGPGRRVGATWVHPGPESDGGSPRRHGRGVEAAAIVCGVEGAQRGCHRLPRLSRRARHQGNENSDRRGLRHWGPGRDRAGHRPGASGRQHHRHFGRGLDAHDQAPGAAQGGLAPAPPGCDVVEQGRSRNDAALRRVGAGRAIDQDQLPGAGCARAG